MSTVDDAGLDQIRRELFERRIRADRRPATKPQAVIPRTAPGPLPLSASQAQLWYLNQLAPASLAYNEMITIRKTGAFDVEALRRAFTKVVARHDAWRTTFATIAGVPHQFVHEPTDIELPLVDLSHLNTEDAVHRANEIAAADSLHPYDLAEGPLIRPRLIRIAGDDHRLYLGLHHLLMDGTTFHRVIFPELVAFYRSYALGLPSPLPEPEAQYADYTTWERDWVCRPEVANRISRWRSRLAGVTPTQLPIDHPRPARPGFDGGTIPLMIEHTTVEALRGAARTAGGTLYHALAAAYAWWLRLYTESTDVVFATPHDLRQRSDLLGVAGYCLTPVVLRCDMSGQKSFTALIGQMRRVVIDALGDVVPFETLVAALGVPRDPVGNPLFQTVFVLEPPLTSPADDWSLQLMESDVRNALGATKFDLSIELDERPEGHVEGRFSFSTELFDRETAHEMVRRWHRLLEVIAAAPDLPMIEHDLVADDERRHQLSWNLTTEHGKSSQSQCVHDIISSQVERTPDAVAVQVANTTMTYRQLDDRAAAIASRLVQAGAGPGSVVAILLDRTPDLVAAIVGILRCGAAFLPLDPNQPAARNTFCVSDAGATIILTDSKPSPCADAVTVINLSDVRARARKRADSAIGVSPADLAYVIYTSGSTGRPKGVMLEHRSLVNLALTMFREFGVGASDTVLSPSSVSFDVGLGDIFCALACGARLVLATAMQATDPFALSRLIDRSGATYMMATPTTWGALVAAGWQGNSQLKAASIGETLTDGLAEALLKRCGIVWNTYGPTEATVITSVVRLVAGDTVTVGKPLPNLRVYITDPCGRLQPVGVPGEISIGGVAVARGYVNRPDEQRRRFGDDPFHAGGRIYRSGDRGRFLPDGRIQHLGRYDDQLKIRGFRIEPREIEYLLSEHPGVGSCAVVPRDAPNGEQQLVAYIVGGPGCPSDIEARDWLRRRLPEYMVPTAFMHLSTLPTNASGKLDKAALPAPSSRETARIGAQPPRSDTEKRIAALWADLLSVHINDVNSDFFDVGGHSLLAARLLFAIEREFAVAVPLSTFLYNGRTVAQLAELLGAESLSGTDDVTVGQPLHFIFPDMRSAMSLRHFTNLWGAAQPIHALIAQPPGGQFDRSLTLEQHARQAFSTIRNQQPDGPLALVGYSLGALLAYEIARQAVDAGQQVAFLGILDMLAPSKTQLLRAQLTLRWRLSRLRRRPARERWAKYGEVALRVIRSGALRPDDDFDYRGAIEIACRYQQPGHKLPMHLFVSEGSAAYSEAEFLGWDQFHKGTMTVHRLAGDHVTMLNLVEVEHLAQLLLESLREARHW